MTKDIESIKIMLEAKSKEMSNDKENYRDLILNSLRSRSSVSHIDKSLLEDPEFAKQAILINNKTYKNFPQSIRDNADVLIHGMTNGYHRDSFFDHCSDRLKGDRDVAKFAVNIFATNFAFVSRELKADKQFVLETLNAHKNQLTDMGFLKITNYDYENIISESSKEIQELCKGQDPIETLTKAIETEKLHAELQKDLSKPKESTIDFARKLSAECKEHVQSKEQSLTQAKPKARMKI